MTEFNPSEIDRDAIRAMRRSYGEQGLTEESVRPNPIKQFQSWLQEAATNNFIVEPNAMVVSTMDDSGPTSRTVLLKDVSETGFTFFTNYQSRKAEQIARNPNLSLLFPWYPMERQVIVLGVATKLSENESADYFATRPWSSQIGAWASSQSAPLSSRQELEKHWQIFADKFPEGGVVPKPPHWGGFVVAPHSIEFWQGRYSRLHDRLRYSRVGANWEIQRIYP